MTDISYRRKGMGFSYRVAGILLRNHCVLMQNTGNEPGYAFPGGQVAFGEIHAESLAREFREELGAEVEVGALQWMEENFFRWNKTRFQQICLTYAVKLTNEIPMEGRFRSREIRAGGEQVWFAWLPIERLRDSDITVYPHAAADLLTRLDQGVQHIIRREQ
jgi:ADP-ribose pyrophosphatase YjhB (NUDIX family)